MIDAFHILTGLNGKNAGIEALREVLVSAPTPLIGRETIQIALIREVHDYTILRTEETRELNTVWTRKSLKDGGDEGREKDGGEVERVAFLASKQKAAESRELEALLRTWNAAAKHEAPECYLKSKLCLACPRCILFGATDVGKGGDKGANIKHRVMYATAFSLLPVDPAVREVHTFNGVDGATLRTGQTLGDRESVRPGALFASIITLRAVTEMELILVLKALLSCTRYGAETRIGGFVRNHVMGVVAAHEEILSPLELTLELAGSEPPMKVNVKETLDAYTGRCATPGAASVLSLPEVDALLGAIQEVEVSRKHLEAAYRAAKTFRQKQGDYMRKSKE